MKIYYSAFFFFITFGMIAILSQSCNTKDDPKPLPQTGTLSDIDGNIYKTVKIGNHWWMAENLKVKHYRNNTVIPGVFNITDTTLWNTKGAYCSYDNSNDSPGLLYNWLTVTDTNLLAPAGWHIASDDEWKTLEQYLGMNKADADNVNWRGTTEGDKLKISGTGYWYLYNDIWGTNESGFSAKAGGCRMFNGGWSSPYGLAFSGFWWTSSTGPAGEPWYRYLDYKNSNIFRYHGPKTYGFSVRCVQDQPIQ